MKHARLSASSASRWMACPGSVALSEGLDSASAVAAEGTFAHHIAAMALGRGMTRCGIARSPKEWLGNTTIVDGHKVTCDQDMVDGVQAYLDAIAEDVQPGDKTWVEVDLTPALSKLHPDLGGTADYIRWRPSAQHLRVRDLKYGAGVVVDPEENLQAMTYALGALLHTGVSAKTVTLTIDQPRIEHAEGRSRDWTFPGVQLLDFAGDLIEGAKRVKPGAPLTPGKAQCRFCPARRVCPALEEATTAVVEAEFRDVVPYNIDYLSDVLNKVASVKARIQAIEEFAYAEATRGVVIPGWKLVAKRAVRKWADEDGMKSWAAANAIDSLAPPVVKSPAQLEKGLKKADKEAMSAFVESKSSGNVLVPSSDDRPAVKLLSADDFAEVDSPRNEVATPVLNLFERKAK